MLMQRIFNIKKQRSVILLQFFKPSQVVLYFQGPLFFIAFCILGNYNQSSPIFGHCIKVSLIRMLRNQGIICSDDSILYATINWPLICVAGVTPWAMDLFLMSIENHREYNVLMKQIGISLVENHLDLFVISDSRSKGSYPALKL